MMIRNVFDLLSLKTFPKEVEPTAANISGPTVAIQRVGKNYGEIPILNSAPYKCPSVIRGSPGHLLRRN